MRVAFISHDAELYGATRSLISLAIGLKRLNIVCYMMLPYKGVATQMLDANNIPYVLIPYTRWAHAEINRDNTGYYKLKKQALIKLYQNIKVLPKVINQLKEWHIDIIYTNTFVTPIGILSAMLIGKPHVWHIREFINTDFYLDWGKPIFRYLLNKSRVRIVTSHALKTYMHKFFVSGNLHVVYNGIAFGNEFDDFFDKTSKENNQNRPYTFAIIGIINENKNQKVAIEALGLVAKKYSNTKLVVVGAGDTADLKHLADSLGIKKHVEFLGHVNDPFLIYSKVDAVLVCSTNEGFGRVAAEAMAFALPVIGFNSTGTAEIIEHEHTGLLYKGGAENLAQCIEAFVTNPSWARDLGLNGWEIAKQKFSIEKYTEAVYNIIKINISQGQFLFRND